MTKPRGCDYDDNEYHGPPITNPNPGKGNRTLTELGESHSSNTIRRIMHSILEEPGPGSNLLNVMPTADADNINLGRNPIGHSNLPTFRERASPPDWYFQQQRGPDLNALEEAARFFNRRVNQAVNESVLNGGQHRYTSDEMRRTLGRRRSLELLPLLQRAGMMLNITSSDYQDNGTEPTYDGRPLADYSEAEWADITDRWRHGGSDHGSRFGQDLRASRRANLENWMRTYRDRWNRGEVSRAYERLGLVNKDLADYTGQEWQLVEACWNGVADRLDPGAMLLPGTLTPTGEALLRQRQERIARRCAQLGIPIEVVVDPGHEDYFNGRPIVEYSEGVFNHLLNGLVAMRYRAPEPGDRPRRGIFG